jgi:hypothetical protein
MNHKGHKEHEDKNKITRMNSFFVPFVSFVVILRSFAP